VISADEKTSIQARRRKQPNWLCQLHLAHFDALIWPPLVGCWLAGIRPRSKRSPATPEGRRVFGAKRRPGLDTGSPEL
jgi:hypothetical protein